MNLKNNVGKNHATIEGLLNPIDWDSSGSPTEYAIYTRTEDEFIIENYPKRKKLKKLLMKRVKAQGKIGKNKFGEKLIYATRLQELKKGATTPLNQKLRTIPAINEFPLRHPSPIPEAC